ncbi:MAG: hypothetical protein H5T92_02695 [Synergistales bacterium]|nr:hypothetical protein [Synergistales bacterium]
MEYTRHQSGKEMLASVRYLPNVDVPRDLASLKAMDIIAFNSEAEQAFVELLAAMCDAAGPAGVPVRSARAEVAFRLGISTETVTPPTAPPRQPPHPPRPTQARNSET